MPVRIAINGFGRIGRCVYRIVANRPDIQVVAVNDVTPSSTLAYLLEHDTVMGRFPFPIQMEGSFLHTGTQKTKMLTESDPSKLPWKELEVDITIESTGVFTKKTDLEKHLGAGSKRVILTVPPKDTIDAMVVMGVNDSILKPEHKLVSNASCTTNCLSPLAKVLHESFGIQKGFMNTVHAYTNDQRLSDMFHKDLRRARAANENIIPTTTGAARAVGKILPELNGKLDGGSMRVPVADGSVVDFVVVLAKKVTVDQVNAKFKEASQGSLKGILQYSDSPIVSSDILKNTHSCIFDAPMTRVIQGSFVKVLAWYDNEWGYSNRVVDLMGKLSSLR